jgi:hypothetical protein
MTGNGTSPPVTDFVHYSSEIETFDPKLDEYMKRIIAFWENKVRDSPATEGTGHAVRGAHAKSLGFARAEVEMLGDAPPAYLQGIYATPRRHDAVIRFSSASNHLGADATLGAVLGFAIKAFDVDGSELDDEPGSNTFDLVLKNNPTFIANTAKHYLFIQEIGDTVGDYLTKGKAGFHQLLTDFVTGKGTLEQGDWAWDELFAFVKAATQTPIRNPLLNTYSTMASVRHGEYVAKVRVAPAADSVEKVAHRQLDLSSGRDVFGPALIDELKAHDFDYHLQIQLCADLGTMPVNDATVEWPERLSPFVTVGRIHLPRQDISGSETLERCDALAFNQWRVRPEHRPLGEIMDVRRIYSTSARVRRELNNQPQTEPTSADEVLPLSSVAVTL